jgi:hypothetical protein
MPEPIISKKLSGLPPGRFDPVTMGHIRGHRVTRLLVYCGAINCNHSATLDADWLADDTILLTLDPRMVCTACGHRGADVRPDWSQRGNRPGPGSAHAR